jgi:agmatine deiminase
MRLSTSLLLAALFFISASHAQISHVKPTKQDLDIIKERLKHRPVSAQKTTANFAMPAGARYPGEFEESQAVAMGWVYDYPSKAIDLTSYYAHLWADMADAIQKECPVWIRIDTATDSTAIKGFMVTRGTPLVSYRFFIHYSDDIWMRDFGPLGFYYSSNDSIGFLDMNYYEGRDLDNLFPESLASALGYPNVRTNLYAEGGNYMTDGFGATFYSDVVEDANAMGPPYQPKHPAWSNAQSKDTMRYAWATNNLITTTALQCDGGTAHIDMYLKLMDEQTLAVMEYPSVVTAVDRVTINNMINLIAGKQTTYGTPYRIFKIPMPTRDDGTFSKNCAQINNDARTFVNGLTVNKTYLMPAYSDASSGNKQGDNETVDIFKRISPGYKVVPLDSRGLTIGGGAVHCVTMQIPAENPILFWHPPVVDIQPLKSSYHLVAKITNKSGIASATCNWRLKGTSSWNNVALTDSSGFWIGNISGSFNKTDQIEYYLSATSNNGKTMTKPIVAPSGGYYTFLFEWPASVNGLDPVRNFAMNPLPNPTSGQFMIPVSFEKGMMVQAYVTDVFGKKIASLDAGKISSGMSKLEFDISAQPQGMYFVQITADGHLLSTKKIIKQ